MKKLVTINYGVAFFFSVFLLLSLSACSDVVSPGGEENSENEFISEQGTSLNSDIRGLPNRSNNNGFIGGSAVECETKGSAILKAGRNSTTAGELTYQIIGGNLVVTYKAASGWAISETHLYVSNSLEDLRTAGNGAPIPGHMPYSSSHNSPVTEVEFVFSIENDLGLTPGDDLYIVAHAVVGELRGGSIRNTETAFAGDEEGYGPRWWWYIKANGTTECNDGNRTYRFAAG